VNRQTPYIVAPNLALARVQADPKIDPLGAIGSDDRSGTADGTGWTIERGNEAVPRGVDLSPPEAPEFVPHCSVMCIEKKPPPLVTEGGCPLGRTHNVSEENGGEEALCLNGWALAGEELSDVSQNSLRQITGRTELSS
jgi:hypothetical protein